MNVRVTVAKDDGIWRAQLALELNGLTPVEQASWNAHEGFEVEVGGSFTGDGLDDVSLHGITFDLELDPVVLPDEFPLIQEFPPEDSLDVTTGQRAAIWAERMLERVTAATQVWLDLSEAWERDTVHTIP